MNNQERCNNCDNYFYCQKRCKVVIEDKPINICSGFVKEKKRK